MQTNLWLPESWKTLLVLPKRKWKVKGHVVLITINELTGEKKIHEGHNIVTNAGDLYYAQLGAQVSPSPDVKGAGWAAYLHDGSPSTITPAKTHDFSVGTGGQDIAGSEKAIESTYQKLNDGDADNTGAGADIITYKFRWVGADGNWTDIRTGMIAASDASGTDPILTIFGLPSAPVNKDANTTLVVYVNHEITGV